MSYPSKPSKRPYDRNSAEQNGKGKWQKSGGFNSQNQPLKFSPGNTVFRILFPVSKSGRLIGKNGTIINNIRQETGVKIKVEEPLTGDDERIIVIVGSEKEEEVINEKNKEGGKDNNNPEKTDEVEENEGNKDKVSSPVVDSQSEKGLSSAQKALFLVFERTVDEEDEEEDDDVEDDEDNKKSASARLLVFSSQVGCILGKGGKVIKHMAAESGAQIRIVPRDKLPQCVSISEDLVQVTGELEAVRKALELVSQQLVNNPPRDILPTTKATGPSNPFPSHSKPETRQVPNFPFSSQVPPYPLPYDRPNYHLDGPHTIPNHRESLNSSRIGPPVEIGFRVLCHIEKVGGIIGKGGIIINMIHRETGCNIRILDGAPASQDRIILVSGLVHPHDRVSAVQDAVLRVQGRIFAGGPESHEKVARLLVSSNHIGCLVGKGGTILAEMRRLSGAYIEIISKNQFPQLPYENDEVVQVTGGFESVQEALMQITSRLRHHHLFGDAFPSSANMPHHQVPPFPYMGRREPSPPPGLYGLPPPGRIHPFDDRPPFANWQHRTPQPGFQGVPDVGRPPLGLPEYPPPGRVQRPLPPPEAIITNTTVEVVVPRDVVPSIYGEDGSSLKQIRKISGAKITIGEPKPGANETGIVISGTPEQAHAAQSLLQAFVLSGTDSP
ncbi:hypothetical protein ACHQM5_017815 [Ranunculus cassubicifolius]